MTRSTVPALLIAGLMLLAGGWILALVVDPAAIFRIERPAAEADAGHEDHDDEHEGHIHLNEAAYRNLKLRIRPVKRFSGKHHMQVPGEIVEKPGHSDHALASPVNGVVTEVYALPGQAIRPGDALFKLQVIDEALASAQLNLLNTIARLATVESELKRISPLAESGTVLGSKKLDLDYEKNELQLKQRLYEQELEVRGLEKSQVATIKDKRELIRELIVHMPEEDHATVLNTEEADPMPESAADETPLRPVSDTNAKRDWEYTVEELTVFPGKSVARGDDLCHVAYHTKLYIEGHVFEDELPYVLDLGEGEKADWTVAATFGTHDRGEVVEGLRVHYVDNHVDPQSQTYRFYVPLKNEVVRDTVDDEGRRFRTWKYKPGQRVHLQVPTDPYKDMIVLPRTAVATEGSNVYVFREVAGDETGGHDHADGENHDHSHGGDVAVDLERVSVVVQQQDSHNVFIAPDGALRPGDYVATDNAYQLYLHQKAQSGGDAGHGHEH